MKCYYHPNVDAVALCSNCNRGLCPDCAVELRNATACRARCEAEVEALAEMRQRERSVYQKTSGAHKRNALMFLVMGVIMTAVGALILPSGWVIVALGVAMFLGAAFSYTNARKIARVGP